MGQRPSFVDDISRVVRQQRKGVILISGNVHDVFRSRDDEYLPIGDILYGELNHSYNVVRLNGPNGLSLFNSLDLAPVKAICEAADKEARPDQQIGDILNRMSQHLYEPLPNLIMIRRMMGGAHRLILQGTKVFEGGAEPQVPKPICAIIEYAGALFEAGELAQLSDIRQQRLVEFLSTIESMDFVLSPNLFILISDAKAEINSKISTTPSVHSVQIDLPGREERRQYRLHLENAEGRLRFDRGKLAFDEDSAGLRLVDIRDLLRTAHGERATVTTGGLVQAVNLVIQSQLDTIVSVLRPAHRPKDLFGYKQTGEMLARTFRMCDDPETAIAALLVCGPNGVGKTFQLEAYAAESGRIVIKLTGIRGSYFGETDRFFEILLWHIRTYGKVLIVVDEADLAFASAYRGDVHPTERRLTQKVFETMGDPTLRGQVLWALGTARPQGLDPDMKDRCPVKIPIFDLESEERKAFVAGLFRRQGIKLGESALRDVLAATLHYSARNYTDLIAQIKAERKFRPRASPVDVLSFFQATTDIREMRELQTLYALQHCSFPNLIPSHLQELARKPLEVQQKIDALEQRIAA